MGKGHMRVPRTSLTELFYVSVWKYIKTKLTPKKANKTKPEGNLNNR